MEIDFADYEENEQQVYTKELVLELVSNYNAWTGRTSEHSRDAAMLVVGRGRF
ncbi:hypothetical protein [Leptospira santarosai]|uniref:hypothetical protein n=1 Tax=Leptospira santarosai TaxID=28183 RepID=UPI0024AEA15D|nr:hypothetical protein [Leptospira santarosai]